MISNNSLEPADDHLPYNKVLAGHDFGFGTIKTEEGKLMNKGNKACGQSKKGCKKCGNEKVNHPAHYNTGKVEVIDAIEDWQLGFNDGNAIKYIARHQYKGNDIQDIEKAIWYLERHLAILKRKQGNEPK